jgi:RNA exonuclease 1
MGVSKGGDSELIRVTMVDYFTNEVLIDNLVFPNVGMQHLNTRFSGVSWDELRQARRDGTALEGRKKATLAVWKFVGPDTVVVGHSVHNDLKSLRWIHTNVVDTYFIEHKLWRDALIEEEMRLEQEARERQRRGEPEPEPQPPEPKKPKVGKGNGPFSLKTLARERLSRQIQRGAEGHDSLEDSVAARDIAQWHVKNTEPFRVREAKFFGDSGLLQSLADEAEVNLLDLEPLVAL